MAVLYISHMTVESDDLGRWVTTLTQEVQTSLSEYQAEAFLNSLILLDEQKGFINNDHCIEYHNDNYTILDVKGYAVEKAMDTVNGLSQRDFINFTTGVDKEAIYRVEIDY